MLQEKVFYSQGVEAACYCLLLADRGIVLAVIFVASLCSLRQSPKNRCAGDAQGGGGSIALHYFSGVFCFLYRGESLHAVPGGAQWTKNSSILWECKGVQGSRKMATVCLSRWTVGFGVK
jgi:hypothetical protein